MIDVAIVGAGPAGLMAGLRLAEAGYHVEIFERMPSPARKFLMAGRGGLNLTHSEPLERFLTRYPGQPSQILDAIRKFGSDDMRRFAHELGQETFVGSSGRIFPKAMKASPMLRAWLSALERAGVSLHARHDWRGFAKAGTHRFATPAGERLVRAKACLLALGGASWPRLGSNGAWQPELQRLGILVHPFKASNVGLRIKWSDRLVSRHSGEPLKRIALRLGPRAARGEAVLTQNGLEGGAIYALSAEFRRAFVAADGAPVFFELDLRPDLSLAELIVRLRKFRPGDSLANRLRKAVQLSPVAIALLHEMSDRPLSQLEPEGLAALIQHLPLEAIGEAGLERAISSVGGIDCDEINADFMLKRLPGLFVAGEMLDWDAPTGGYLLQATIASAYVAASGIREWLHRSA